MYREIVEIHPDACERAGESNSKFWLVWNPNGSSPRFRHLTMESAQTEAQRLARQSPSDCFIVLEAIARYEAAPPVQETPLQQLAQTGAQIGSSND